MTLMIHRLNKTTYMTVSSSPEAVLKCNVGIFYFKELRKMVVIYDVN